MTLSEIEIRRRLNPNTSKYNIDRLIVTPLLDPNDQISQSGIDLRLGKQFILFKTHISDSLNPVAIKADRPQIKKYQEEIIISSKNKFVLHPGQFILGSTFEYLGIPGDLDARIDGRSSWARMGLLIATASTIQPYFKGVVTLELTNHGSIPIVLYPGLKIAFITFKLLDTPVKYNNYTAGKYVCSIGPGYTKIYEDNYIEYITNHF
ncbi:MAG: dCTP deaminase [Candidatus Neomarinimicrobiota bacterium]